LVLAICLTVVASCLPTSGKPEQHVLAPGDFASADPGRRGTTGGTTAGKATEPAPSPAQGKSIAVDAPTPRRSSVAADKVGLSMAVDAMVGHVNGQAIYASKVFDLVGDDELAARGGRLSRQAFGREARDIVTRRLMEVVINVLLLAEAEAALNEQQQAGLRHVLKERRAEFVRKFGAGSPEVADRRLRREEGLGLDDKVEEFRRAAIVESHKRQTLTPKINISRKDIIRYYRDHQAEFNPKSGRRIYMISTGSDTAAETIDRLLSDEARPFLEIASDAALNNHRAKQGGFFAEALEGEQVFNLDALNEAVVSLESGQHTKRVTIKETYYWLWATKTNAGKAQTLKQAQSLIRRRLIEQRYSTLAIRYQAQLFHRGSFDPRGPDQDPLEPMVDTLLEVAMSRYALPE
jgi:hypothetical protein